MSSETQLQFIEVAPLTYTGPDRGSFTYAVPGGLGEVVVGQVVQVPLGRGSKISTGMVTATGLPKPDFTTKPIADIVPTKPLPAHMVELASWLQSYYFSSAKSVWQTLLPSGITKKRRTIKAAPVVGMEPQRHPLNAEQAAAAEMIEGSNKPVLLQGITGSGKTRVYLELAERALAAGKSAIILLPEIALTPQLIGLFNAHFADRVITAHSGLTEAQRHAAWQRALEADDKNPVVVVGARSALFLPLAHPGLIVVDECHETTYKQEQNPRYHAVTAAAQLARLTGAKLVLGSATPGLGEVYLAEAERIQLAKLTERASGQPLAPAKIIDLRERTNLGSRSKFISLDAIKAIGTALANGEQALLFLNRRGTASSQSCNSCGHVTACATCYLPMTFHADQVALMCHICGRRQAPAAVCPECSEAEMRYLGGGTKRIEAEIATLFPEARVGRIDADSQAGADPTTTYESLMGDAIDIIIGTQMVAKGLDLPRLSTAVVVNADGLLHLPDYTAAERTVQLLMQVAGRVGRRGDAGTVLIQTRTPDHPAIRAAATGDFWGFAETELKHRRELGYPPYRFMMKLGFRHKDGVVARREAADMTTKLKGTSGIALLGPAPAFHERAGGWYHWQLIVKAASRPKLVELARTMPPTWSTDLDPVNLL